MGCNVVASRNCGNWRLCHPDLLLETFTVPEFERRINRSLNRRFAGNMVQFTNGDAYERLKEIIREQSDDATDSTNEQERMSMTAAKQGA